VPFDCGERFSGSTKYSLRKMLKLGWHGVSAFSLVPLRIGIGLGLASSTLAFLSVGLAIFGKWLDDSAIPGWASSVAISSFLFGVLFVFLAVLAEYVGRIAVEVRRRPRFLVRETTHAGVAAADRRPQRAKVVDFPTDA
jgi:dolichol-phosphate mannosyltransferase